MRPLCLVAVLMVVGCSPQVFEEPSDATPLDGGSQFPEIDACVGAVDAGSNASGALHVVELDGGFVGTIRVENLALPRSSGADTAIDTYNNLDAQFVRRVPCATTQEGECLVSTCTGEVVADHDVLASAGLLTFRGFHFRGGVDLTTLMFFPYGAGSPRPETMWDGGEPVSVIAQGGEVPAFESEVAAPSPFIVRAPRCEPYCTSPVDRAQPLVLSWTAAPIGDVVVELRAGWSDDTGRPDPHTATTVRCRTPVGSTGITIPPAVLQHLPATTRWLSATIEVARISDRAFDAGPWAVSFEVAWVALSSTVALR